MEKFNTGKSKKLYEELKKVLLDGVASSFHKAAGEEYPVAISHGKGPCLYDIDGNEYIDYINGLGPMILGYANEEWNQAIIEQLKLGTHFSAPNELLLKLAKKLVEIIPCAEIVSFQNSGTEANLFAFRTARAYTGKNVIVKFEGQYHGWADEEKISIDADRAEQLGDYNCPNKIIHNPGQPESSVDNVLVLPWNNAAILKKTLEERNDIAAVIMEPFMCDSGPVNPVKGYLEEVRRITKDAGVVLIFDEVITGFHMALGGAQEYYHIVPDLATFAKALTGGLPMAVIAGKKEIMQCGVHPSGTFNGNALSVAAALHTVSRLQDRRVYEEFERLGAMLCDGIKSAAAKYGIPMYTDHAGAICTMLFGTDRQMRDFRDCLRYLDYNFYDQVVMLAREYGLRLTPKRGRMYLSLTHTETEIQKTIAILDCVFKELTK